MSATVFHSRSTLNPDEDFVLHGRPASYWERSGYLSNSRLTDTTSRLSQHSVYDPANYRENQKERRYARSMVDLANNLEYLSDQVDHTLTKGVTFKRNDGDRLHNVSVEPRKIITAEDFREPASLHETLRTDVTEDELLDLYEKKVGELDSMGGNPISPRDSQWFVNPNHLDTSAEAPTLRTIGSTYRYGVEKSKKNYSDKDVTAMDFFPVTLGSAYELCAKDFPASDPMNASAPPSMRRSRSKSATRLRRSQSCRTKDHFDVNQDIDKSYLMTVEAPTIGFSPISMTSPHQLMLGKLRLERLRLEEAKLLELKRMEELERIRGPKPKWYESKGPDFFYEAHKNTQMIKTESQFQDLLDYREDLLRSTYNNMKKYNRQIEMME